MDPPRAVQYLRRDKGSDLEGAAATEADVRVHIRRFVVQVRIERASIGTIVPIAAADNRPAAVVSQSSPVP